MARNIGPKCKQCRREGAKLFLKGERCQGSKCAIVKRNYAPGMHGQKGRGRMTGYATQLREKQKAKRIYGILERQFRQYYENAKAAKGKTGEMMLTALERRLDNVLYRSGFASSRSQGRQMVTHGQLLVNGSPLNIPAYQVEAGDVITIKVQKQQRPLWKNMEQRQLSHLEIPTWLNVNTEKQSVTVAALPNNEHIQSELQMNYIIELYSL